MYNDFAIINEQDFVKVANEYNKLMKASALTIENNEKINIYINEIVYQLNQLKNIAKYNRHKENINDIIVQFENVINNLGIKQNIKFSYETNSQKIIYCNIIKDVLLKLFNLVINITKNEHLNIYKEDLISIFQSVLNLLGECKYRW